MLCLINVVYIDVHHNQLAIQQRELVLNVVCNLKIITYLSLPFVLGEQSYELDI